MEILKRISECWGMLKSLGKGKKLISCDVIFRFYCYSVYYSSEDYRQLNMAKSKVLVFKIAGNWGGFPLQTRYLIKKIFLHVGLVIYILCILHWFWTCCLVSYFDWDALKPVLESQTTWYLMEFCKFIEFTL